MKVIIAGSRSITSYDRVKRAIEQSGFEITEVVSGRAEGVDKLGERYARDMKVGCKEFPADWGKHGRKAGFLRNQKMAEYADGLIAVWDGRSNGTAHMINVARAKNLKVYVGRSEG